MNPRNQMKGCEEKDWLITHPSSSVLELIEGSGISLGALLPNAPSELSKVHEVITDATFVAEDSGNETHHRKCPDDPVGEIAQGVGVIHVGFDTEVFDS